MDLEKEYQEARNRLQESFHNARLAYQAMCEQKYGFTKGDIIEYPDDKGIPMTGIFNGWEIKDIMCNEAPPSMTIFKKDGSLSLRTRLLYDPSKARLIKNG